MDKTLKRQIGFKPEKKSAQKSNGKAIPVHEKGSPVAKQLRSTGHPPINDKPSKMGRKPKAPQDIVKIAHVWITDKEKEELEAKYGSLTKALKTLL